MSQRSIAGFVGSVAGLALATSVAQAGFTDPGIKFTATNAQGTATVSISLAQGAPLPGGGWQWVLVGPPIAITTGGGAVLGTITQGSITMMDSGNRMVASSFAVTSGLSATNFVISSGESTFGAMLNPDARASAGLTVTDNTGNGASVTGNRPGGNVYSAHINGQAPAGSTFSNLIAGPLVEPNAFGSESTNQSFPAAPGAFTTIAGSVSSMSTMWDFTVTANDQASGTSVFVLVPGPGGVALLGISGLALARRRRA